MARKAEPVSASAKIALSTGQRSDSKDHRNRDNDNNSCHKLYSHLRYEACRRHPIPGDAVDRS
jgi:hypothetical protein